MKNYFLCFISIFLFSNFLAAQTANLSENAQKSIIASYTIPSTNNIYESAKGEAFANVILNAFRLTGKMPQGILIPDMTINDKAKCEQLVSELIVLEYNPPTWEQLFQDETDRLISVDKAQNRHSKYMTIIERQYEEPIKNAPQTDKQEIHKPTLME